MGRSRACFSSSVISTDAFLDLPPTAQAAYFQLSVDADNDGAVDGFKRRMRSYGASDDDAQALFDGGYLIEVNSVVFIRHWKINNTLDTHNYRPGSHTYELSLIDQGQGEPYQLSDVYQTDISLTLDEHQSQKKEKSIEQNKNKFNNEKSNRTKERERESTPESEIKMMACPHCNASCAVVEQSGRLHGFCDSCGADFFATRGGEYL